MTHEERERLLIELLPNIRAEASKFARRAHQSIEDSIQDAILFAWVSLKTFDESHGVKPWTYVSNLVRWKLADKFRSSITPRRKPDGHYPESLNIEVQDRHPNLVDQLRDFREYLGPCREREAAALTAIYVEGKTCTEMAQAEGISTSAMTQVARRGLERLREFHAKCE